ncbi:hypothetical protein PFUGPA_05989 [Plasmodium falciparum Palo Alto/Uganda]|uniref:Rifin n=1 Tax=Plasmodium falciparum (isolate Palo Alto / Uganda) TaxID=57270 RepID=W4IRQ3_PLAFP|nr:hypothetical protein PFUGPA_05989 [Plasmodium falciparum Palo Alto/Uganda]
MWARKSEGTADIAAAANAAGAAEIIKLIKSKYFFDELGVTELKSFFYTQKYNDVTNYTQAVQKLYYKTCAYDSSGSLRFHFADANRDIPFCQSVWNQAPAVSQRGQYISPDEIIKRTVKTMMSEAEGTANAAAEIAESTKIATIKEAEEKTIEAASTQLYGAIGCLRCGYGLGTVAPTVGLIGAVAVHQWTNAALVAAAKKGIEVGMAKAIEGVKKIWELGNVPGVNFGEVVNSTNYFNKDLLAKSIYELSDKICSVGGIGSDKTFCIVKLTYNREPIFIKYVTQLTKTVAQDATTASTEAKDVALANATNATHSFNIAIIASVVSIVVIVLVMVIIYLILRYRRKKKMKKKLEYIKLLKE